MRKAIDKAREHGLAFASVRNSNHYGIAAYYAMLALEHGLIGLSMTNSTHLTVPTFGRQKTQGTNPISVAIPADGHAPFVLDMSTSAATFGRLEVNERKGKSLKPGWAVDAQGCETLDPTVAMTAGALLPLGGHGTEGGGHKGYGLGALVEILCGVLSGGMFGTDLGLDERGLHGGSVGHFFGAFRIDALRDAQAFERDLARELHEFEESAPVPGAERVVTAGEPERANTERYRREGVPIDPKVWVGLDDMAERLGIEKLERFSVD
jgi:L-2-hydroxycarboxylate dehydrogenase (NAD+)